MIPPIRYKDSELNGIFKERTLVLVLATNRHISSIWVQSPLLGLQSLYRICLGRWKKKILVLLLVYFFSWISTPKTLLPLLLKGLFWIEQNSLWWLAKQNKASLWRFMWVSKQSLLDSNSTVFFFLQGQQWLQRDKIFGTYWGKKLQTESLV